uniref:DUS-like FMN-binding domain-containing protein n=1 Tax=Quercus lobata TaxID=97700 RepID=A0A7N2M0S7_QUELO
MSIWCRETGEGVTGARKTPLATKSRLSEVSIRVVGANERVADRPRDPAKWSEIADVVAALSIPVIANGDIFEYDDFQCIKDATGASSVMVARGALWNASIFSPKGKVSQEDVKREYIRKSILWDNDIKITKHTLKEMIMHYSSLELPEGKAVIKSESLADLASDHHHSSDPQLRSPIHSSDHRSTTPIIITAPITDPQLQSSSPLRSTAPIIITAPTKRDPRAPIVPLSTDLYARADVNALRHAFYRSNATQKTINNEDQIKQLYGEEKYYKFVHEKRLLAWE